MRNSCQDQARRQPLCRTKKRTQCQHRQFLFPFGIDRANAEKRAAANAPPKSQLKAMAEGNKFKCPKCMVWYCKKGIYMETSRVCFADNSYHFIAYDRQLQIDRAAHGSQAPQGASSLRGIIQCGIIGGGGALSFKYPNYY